MPMHINRVYLEKDVALHHAQTVIHFEDAVTICSYIISYVLFHIVVDVWRPVYRLYIVYLRPMIFFQ